MRPVNNGGSAFAGRKKIIMPPQADSLPTMKSFIGLGSRPHFTRECDAKNLTKFQPKCRPHWKMCSASTQMQMWKNPSRAVISVDANTINSYVTNQKLPEI